MPRADGKMTAEEWKRHIAETARAEVEAHTISWGDRIEEVLADGETIVAAVGDLSTPFYGGFGTHGCPVFTAWTESRVFFSIQYDGAEYLASAPRNPCADPIGPL